MLNRVSVSSNRNPSTAYSITQLLRLTSPSTTRMPYQLPACLLTPAEVSRTGARLVPAMVRVPPLTISSHRDRSAPAACESCNESKSTVVPAAMVRLPTTVTSPTTSTVPLHVCAVSIVPDTICALPAVG